MPRVVTAVVAILMAVSFSLSAAPKKDGPVDLNLTDLDGKKVHLKDYRGKIVVLNFWATWCGPCREEMPMFVEVEKEWAKKGIVFLAASLDDKKGQKNIPEFIKKYQIDFPVWTGATGDDLFHLGMGETVAVPDTLFINEEGTVFARVAGEIKKEQLLERLEWASGDRSRPAPQPLLRSIP